MKQSFTKFLYDAESTLSHHTKKMTRIQLGESMYYQDLGLRSCSVSFQLLELDIPINNNC